MTNTIEIAFKEPVRNRYIYVDPETNRVHLLIPITGGLEISTDTTCQTTASLKKFFGKDSEAVKDRITALDELNQYAQALEYDIALLGDINEELRNKKADRLKQIKAYINALEIMKHSEALSSLNHTYVEYPPCINKIVENSNLYSMLLCPRDQDGYLYLANRAFTAERESKKVLFDTLTSEFRELPPINLLSAKAVLKQATLNQLEQKRNKNELHLNQAQLIQKILRDQTWAFYKRKDVSYDTYFDGKENKPLTVSVLEEVFAGSTNEDFLETILNAYSETLATFPGSPFSTISELQETYQKTERTSILTQFFLGEINIYCQGLGISKVNFGKVFDEDKNLCTRLVRVVKNALQQGISVENAIIAIINEEQTRFGLTRQLSAADIDLLTSRYYSHFNMIKLTPHFDEFAVLMTTEKPKFYQYRFSIVFKFMELVKQSFSNLLLLFPQELKQDSKILPQPIPENNQHVAATFSMEMGELKNYINQLLDADEVIRAKELLLLTTAEGKLFQSLDENMIKNIKTKSCWTNLHHIIARSISDQATLSLFNNIFEDKMCHFNLSFDMARALHVAVIEKEGSIASKGYATLADIRELMLKLGFGLQSDEICFSYHSGFTLILSEENKEKLEGYLKKYLNTFYINSSMAAKIYEAVGHQYDPKTKEYKDMNALSNRDDVTPFKMKKALELLEVSVSNIRFPKDQKDGYILTTDADGIALIENMQFERFRLDSALVKKLYNAVEMISKEAATEMNALDNKELPRKIKYALDYLEIPYQDITFHGTSGYLLLLTPNALELLRSKVNGGNLYTTGSNGGRSNTQPHLVSINNLLKPPMMRIHQQCSLTPNTEVSALPTRTARTIMPVSVPKPEKAPKVQISRKHLFREPETNTRELQIEKVAAFREVERNSQSHLTQLNCPEPILKAFQKLLKDTAVLGCYFINPYTQEREEIPSKAKDLTARHLQILARIEKFNVDGKMNLQLLRFKLNEFYTGLLSGLIKGTTVASFVDVTHYGGYGGTTRYELEKKQKVIVVDQAGLQWQDSFFNTGGMLFYPAPEYRSLLPKHFEQWQENLFSTLFGIKRPDTPSLEKVQANWNGVEGYLDLDLVAHAIAVEFRQFLDATVAQSALHSVKEVDLRYLKAGMGFFADGLKGEGTQLKLEHARLKGIALALKEIGKIADSKERRKLLGPIVCLTLPYSAHVNGINDKDIPPGFVDTLKEIQSDAEELGLQWGGAGKKDAFEPHKNNYTIATNNCGDTRAMPGNEGKHQSVDASLYTNGDLSTLNAAFNKNMQIRQAPLYGFKPSIDKTNAVQVNPSVILPVTAHEPRISRTAVKPPTEPSSTSNVNRKGLAGWKERSYRNMTFYKGKVNSKLTENEVGIEKVEGYKETTPANHPAFLYCSKNVMDYFKKLLTGEKILGCEFLNPYTGEKERIPANVEDLTPRHLQILARAEKSGAIVSDTLYNQKLSSMGKICHLRMLAVQMPIVAEVPVQGMAGYREKFEKDGYLYEPSFSNPYKEEQKMIVIDMPSIEWKQDFFNNGIFFIKEQDAAWFSRSTQINVGFYNDMHHIYDHAIVKECKTRDKSSRLVIQWSGAEMHLDAHLLTHAYQMEFLQSWYALENFSNEKLNPNEKIHFRFMKQTQNYSKIAASDVKKLELIRLKGVLQALNSIKENQSRIGKISFPFCRFEFAHNDPINNEYFKVIKAIEKRAGELHLEWGGVDAEDPYALSPGYRVACTTASSANHMLGHPAGSTTLDALMYKRGSLNALNACANPEMICKPLEIDIWANELEQLSKVAADNPQEIVSILETEQPGKKCILSAIHKGLFPAKPVEHPSHCNYKEMLLKEFVHFFADKFKPGTWMAMGSIEVGYSSHDKMLTLSSHNYQLTLTDEGFKVFMKLTKPYKTIENDKIKAKIVDLFFKEINESDLRLAHLGYSMRLLSKKYLAWKADSELCLKQLCWLCKIPYESNLPTNVKIGQDKIGRIYLKNDKYTLTLKAMEKFELVETAHPEKSLSKEEFDREIMNFCEYFPAVNLALGREPASLPQAIAGK